MPAWNQLLEWKTPWHYRNKAQFPFGYDKEGNVVTGFYAGRSHNIIANTDCAWAWRKIRRFWKPPCIYEKIWSFRYDETSGKGLIRHVLIRKGFASGSSWPASL